MKEELMKILPDLQKAIETGVAYAGDLYQRAIDYYLLINIIGGATLLILWIVLVHFTTKSIKELIKDDGVKCGDKDYLSEGEEGFCISMSVFGAIILIFITILLVICVGNIIQLYTVPEIFIFNILK